MSSGQSTSGRHGEHEWTPWSLWEIWVGPPCPPQTIDFGQFLKGSSDLLAPHRHHKLTVKTQMSNSSAPGFVFPSSALAAPSSKDSSPLTGSERIQRRVSCTVCAVSFEQEERAHQIPDQMRLDSFASHQPSKPVTAARAKHMLNLDVSSIRRGPPQTW